MKSPNTLKRTPGFLKEIAATPGARHLGRCFDCGTCSGVCPVSEAGAEFDPRKVLHMIKMGFRESLLQSPMIWQCTACDTCSFVCPQSVRFSSIVIALREFAVRHGYPSPDGAQPLGAAPCKAACPAHISIPGFIGAILDGRYEEGLRLIKEEMPFPGICGRVCPHPCETACNRGQVDQPVAIEALKRFLADRNQASDPPPISKNGPTKSEKVAVIGAGPAGLTAAYYLSIQAYPVTVFEKLPVAGGMMAVGIPEFRLPRKILQSEIEAIQALGVDIRLNVEIGRDVPFKEIHKGFQAVFVGSGCDRSIRLGIPGEDECKGVMGGIDFLKAVHMGRSPKRQGRLVVIGGGNTAVDCARVARRLGYQDVRILYRRTREEMPASSREIDETLEEGIQVQFLTAPVRILGQNGNIAGIECVRMTLGEPDASGRRRPIPVENSTYQVPADGVISAVGQRPDLTGLPFADYTTPRGLLKADLFTGMTPISGVFSGGDVVSGPKTVVEAVAAGKRAARSIDAYLRGRSPVDEVHGEWAGISSVPGGIEHRERPAMPRISPQESTRSFREIHMGYPEDLALREAGRCLRLCGMQGRTAPEQGICKNAK
jgi:NADPH-dependent glutamate synthase beta subunit-like oxidoreductase